MTFLGLEKPQLYTPIQIFDPTAANIEARARDQYINMLYNDYQQGVQDMKEFYKEYGGFLSPIQKDMDWYANNVTGVIQNYVNDLYAKGIDPLRSAEGRAGISRLIAGMPYGKIAQLRQSAETAKEYVKNYGKLAAAGLLNEDAEKNYFGRDLTTWDTINGSGVWGASSPMENKTMDEIIEPIIKNLDYTYDAERTKQANDGNDYYTVTEDRIRQTIADAMPDLMTDKTMGGYYYNKALQMTGDPDKAKALYTDWLVNRGKDHLKEKFTPNEWKKLEKEHQYRMAEKKYAASLRSNGGGGGSKSLGTYDFATDIYDKGLNNIVGNPGGHMYELGPGGVYVSAEQYFQGSEAPMKAQEKFGLDVRKRYKRDDVNNRMSAYRKHYTHTTDISGKVFAEYLGRSTYEEKLNNNANWKDKGVVRMDRTDAKHIRTVDQMITNTAGYTGTYRKGDTQLIENIKKDPNKYVMGGGNIDIYGAFDKPGAYRNDFIVSVYDRLTGNYQGDVAYDSNINSERVTGGLYQGNKNYKVNTSRNLTTRNSVQERSTRVNKLLGETRPQKMPDLLPYAGGDGHYEEEDE